MAKPCKGISIYAERASTMKALGAEVILTDQLPHPRKGEHDMPNKYTHVFWDWNGTLLNDAEVCMKSINTLLSQRCLSPIEDIQAYRDIFGFPIKEFYRRAGFDFSKEPFEIPAAKYIKLYHSDNSVFRLFEGAIEVLMMLKQMNLHQIILSASELANLHSQIKLFNIQYYFDEILGISDIYANSKVKIGCEYIIRMGIEPNKAILIGDTIHDYEVAEAIGMDCILISSGHQHRKKLLECSVPVLDDISDVISVISSSII